MTVSVADQVFLVLGLSIFGGAVFCIGFSLHMAYTKMELMLEHLKNCSIVRTHAPLKSTTVSCASMTVTAPFRCPVERPVLRCFSATAAPPSCQTPSVSVAMGDDYQLHEFRDANSTPRTVRFNIALNQCQAGIQKVTYSLKANTTGTDFKISLPASYYRLTTAELKAGSANTEVTFTVNYL